MAVPSLEQASEYEVLVLVRCSGKLCMREPGGWNPVGGSRKISQEVLTRMRRVSGALIGQGWVGIMASRCPNSLGGPNWSPRFFPRNSFCQIQPFRLEFFCV